MDRNFRKVNSFPNFPSRRCLKKTGPLDVSLSRTTDFTVPGLVPFRVAKITPIVEWHLYQPVMSVSRVAEASALPTFSMARMSMSRARVSTSRSMRTKGFPVRCDLFRSRQSIWLKKHSPASPDDCSSVIECPRALRDRRRRIQEDATARRNTELGSLGWKSMVNVKRPAWDGMSLLDPGAHEPAISFRSVRPNVQGEANNLFSPQDPKILALEVVFGTGPGLAGTVIGVGALLAITVIAVIVVGVEKHRLDVIEDHTQELFPVQNLE